MASCSVVMVAIHFPSRGVLPARSSFEPTGQLDCGLGGSGGLAHAEGGLALVVGVAIVKEPVAPLPSDALGGRPGRRRVTLVSLIVVVVMHCQSCFRGSRWWAGVDLAPFGEGVGGWFRGKQK